MQSFLDRLSGRTGCSPRTLAACIGLAMVISAALLPDPARAADPAFVGVLALFDDPEVGDQLGLSPDQRSALAQHVRQRESAAVELAIEAAKMDRSERDRKQAEFVAQSERDGLAILSDDQRDALGRIRLAREGLAALSQSMIADQVGLADEQRGQVRDILAARQAELAKTDDPRKQRIARAIFDRRLDGILTDKQRLRWQSLTEVTPSHGIADSAQPPGNDNGLAGVDAVAAVSPRGGTVDANGALQFNFQYAPWKNVLEWFADQAGLSLVTEGTVPGSFNFADQRAYSPDEALDVINSVLLTKGYTVVRRGTMMMLINLEDGIPPNLVTTIPVTELDARGEFELVSVLFRLGSVPPEEAEPEIHKLLGPQGDVQVLAKAKQVFVVETAGRLRTIRDVLRAMEDPDGSGDNYVTTFKLNHIMPDEAFAVIRQMLGLPEDMNASADGSLRMATDVLGERIMVTGPSKQVEQVGQILKLVDVPLPSFGLDAGGALASPQLQVYPIVAADAESVLQVLQTLLSEKEVRLATDPKTGNLIALALPTDHAMIRDTLRQMQQGGRMVEVIHLRIVDPQLAVLAINQLFGGEEGNADAPKVNADVTTGQLLVRGSQAQIDQIRSLLDKMGEDDAQFADSSGAANLRVLPIHGSEAEAVLQQIQQIWPTMRPNKIRTVVPSNVIRSMRTNQSRPGDEAPPNKSRSRESGTPPTSARPPNSAHPIPAGSEKKTESPVESSDAPPLKSGIGGAISPGRLPRRVVTWPRPTRDPRLGRLIAQAPAGALPFELTEPAPRPAGSRDGPGSAVNETPTDAVDQSGADIVVAIGASGLIIASQDGYALDDFEQLLTTLAGGAGSGARDFAVFYLRHATADGATQILNAVLGGDSGGEGEGGGLLDGLTDAAVGGLGGDLVGSLLGLGGDSGGGLTTLGTFSIVPEPRLNLLVVQAKATDMRLIEQLLEIIDQRASPEAVQTIPPPRPIPVYHTNAEQVASVVRDVFASHMAAGPGQQQQPSPQEFIRALRGSRGGQSGSDASEEDTRQLTIGVDTRGNQLIVAAPDDLFRQVETLVKQLDQEDPDSVEMTRVITLDGNPELIRRALRSIVGTSADEETTTSGGASAVGQGQRRGGATATPAGNTGRRGGNGQEMRQQFELFRALQGAGGGRGGAGRAGGRGGRGGGRGGDGTGRGRGDR